MGLFSSPKGINEKEIEELLGDIPTLTSVQRAYIKGLFVQYRSGGITELEIEKAMKELRVNTGDGIDRQAAEKVHAILTTFLLEKHPTK